LRALDTCEYCLMPTTSKFEVEHMCAMARQTVSPPQESRTQGRF